MPLTQPQVCFLFQLIPCALYQLLGYYNYSCYVSTISVLISVSLTGECMRQLQLMGGWGKK